MKKKATPIANMRAMMKQLGMDPSEIDDKIQEYKELKDWTPITLKELMNMSTNDLNKLKSYCWKDNSPRCQCIGITDLKITKCPDREGAQVESYDIEWSDENGDPHVYGVAKNELIKNNNVEYWEYGLYKKSTK